MREGPDLVGRTVVAVRHMTEEELETEGWGNYLLAPTVIVLDDTTIVYPSRDDEGNGPGVLFGVDKDGAFRLLPE